MKSTLRKHVALLSKACLAAMLFMNWSAQAITGDLDVSFGNNGKLTTDFLGSEDYANEVIIQPDGKIVVAGYSWGSGLSRSFALARYTADGSLDPSFGNGGKAMAPALAGFDNGNALAIQPDGKLLVGGVDAVPEGRWGFAIARFNEDGSLDKSFGKEGKAVEAVLSNFSRVRTLKVLPDGKILAGGNTDSLEPIRGGFAVARFNPDGSLDPAFGSGGKAVTEFLSAFSSFGDLLVQPNGKIVAAGTSYDPISQHELLTLTRWNSDGSLDSGFGSQGKVLTTLGEGAKEVGAVALLLDGKIIVGGSAYRAKRAARDSEISISDVSIPPNEDMALARFNKDGSLDISFGDGGKLLRDIGYVDRINALSVQPDGKIVVTGFVGKTQFEFSYPRDFNLLLSRFNTDGSLDVDFKPTESASVDGRIQSSFGQGLAFQPDNKIAVAGYISASNGNADFLLLRYDAGPVIAEPDFALDSEQTIINARRGKKAEVVITIDRVNGFAGNVTVLAPDTNSLKVKINEPVASTAGDSVSFKLKIKQSAPKGSHDLIFTGKDDAGKERAVKIILVIK